MYRLNVGEGNKADYLSEIDPRAGKFETIHYEVTRDGAFEDMKTL